MKTFVATFLVLFLSLPTAMAGNLDGKGVWCPADVNEESFGFWFEEGKADRIFLKAYAVSYETDDYIEETTRIVIDGHYRLDRRTLKLFTPSIVDRQCYLSPSRAELVAKLKDISAAAEAKNKI